MTQEITKELMCIKVREGMEVWVEKEKIENLIAMLINHRTGKFIKVEGELINTVDVVGIFTAETMEDITRRKNCQWKCLYNFWHSKGEECAHHLMPK